MNAIIMIQNENALTSFDRITLFVPVGSTFTASTSFEFYQKRSGCILSMLAQLSRSRKFHTSPPIPVRAKRCS
jgi:hypothetical protein